MCLGLVLDVDASFHVDMNLTNQLENLAIYSFLAAAMYI